MSKPSDTTDHYAAPKPVLASSNSSRASTSRIISHVVGGRQTEASIALFHGVAADDRILLKLDHAAADRAALVRQPIDRRRGDLLRRHDLPRWRVYWLDLVRPVGRQTVLDLRLIFVIRQHPADVKLVHAHSLVAKRVGQVARKRHERT